MLSLWGVEYEPVNVEADPNAISEMERMGVKLVPVVVDGGRVFHGWNPEGLAEFLGVEHEEASPLSPLELVARLEKILVAAERTIQQTKAEHLHIKIPNRDRTVRELAWHIFRLSVAYRDAMEEGYFSEVWLQETPPPETVTGKDIAAYGHEVQERLTDWFRRPESVQGTVETYYGKQTAHQLLERTTWHAAQHLRQLCALLEEAGEKLRDPLSEQDFAGLPLPKELW